MSYNDQEFERLIKQATTFSSKSMQAVKDVMCQKKLPQDLVPKLKVAIANMPADEKTRYNKALAYLEREFAHALLGIPQPTAPAGLRTELKNGWTENFLRADTILVHCTAAAPRLIMPGGIDPKFSSEWCVPVLGINAFKWDWNRFAFLFMLEEENFPPKGARNLGFTDAGFIYIVNVPQGTIFMNQNGTVVINTEIAFPEKIEARHIVGVFQFQTGDNDAPPRTPPRKKMDYTLTQLRLTSPYDPIATVDGRNSTDPGSIYAGRNTMNLLGLP